MAQGVNKAILIGNLGKDPEVRTLESGTKVVNFSLATTESYRNKNGEKIDQTEWHNIVLWRGLAEIAEKYLQKGSQVYIEGRIINRSWEDKEGNKRYITEIVGDNLTLLARRKEQASNWNKPSEDVQEKKISDDKSLETQDDDLPL